MEVDTGAAVSIVPIGKLKAGARVRPSTKRLKSATGQLPPLAGESTVRVQVENTTKVLTVYVAQSECPSLFGRDWISVFFENQWMRRLVNHSVVNAITQEESKPAELKRILEKYAQSVFKPGLGQLKGITAQLKTKPECQPKFYKPRPVPYALKPKVEETIERMVAEGNLEKLDYSDWATPIVPVMKPDGTAKICGDYKVTLNPCLQVQQQPIPRVEECFQAMNGRKKFSKIDLSQAYNQVMLNEDSKNSMTINTHLGLYHWNRLPYGIASSPAIFQGIMDKILHGMTRVVWYLNDILVTGETEEEHLRNLDEVLARLEKHGLQGRISKCKFFHDLVEYLGHQIDREGIKPMEEKVTAITNAPTPTTV